MSEIVKKILEPFPHLIIENIYNDEELELIWEELKFLNKPGKMLPPNLYGASRHLVTGQYATKARALELESVYQNKIFSNILQVNRKVSKKYSKEYASLSPHYVKFLKSNIDLTKVRYYNNGEDYKPHSDYPYDVISCTYFHKEPKNFEGGELFFPEYNYEVTCKNNMCIIFPPYFVHGVKKITMENSNLEFGRYCVTQFFSILQS
jgi:Rps23 Pro-64 3,4-dihydroxylase Tpa1-like proline 4-hydroxylase